MSGYVTAMRALVGSRPLLLVAAGVAVLDLERRLLLQRRSDDNTWCLPGGALEPGETLLQTARRELREETGLEVADLTLLDVFSGPEFYVHYPNGDEAYVVGAVFLAQGCKGDLRTDSEETTALAYFCPHHLPEEVNGFNQHLLRQCVPLLVSLGAATCDCGRGRAAVQSPRRDGPAR